MNQRDRDRERERQRETETERETGRQRERDGTVVVQEDVQRQICMEPKIIKSANNKKEIDLWKASRDNAGR